MLFTGLMQMFLFIFFICSILVHVLWSNYIFFLNFIDILYTQSPYVLDEIRYKLGLSLFFYSYLFSSAAIFVVV